MCLARRAIPLRYVAEMRHVARMVAVNQPSLFAALSTSHVAHPPSLTAVLTIVVARKAILTAVLLGESAAQRPVLTAVLEGAAQRPVLTAVLTHAAQQPILSAAPPTAVPAVHIAADRGSAARADQQEQTRFLLQPLKKFVACSTSLNRSLLFAQKRRLNPRHRLESLLMLGQSHGTPYLRGKLLHSVVLAIRMNEKSEMKGTAILATLTREVFPLSVWVTI